MILNLKPEQLNTTYDCITVYMLIIALEITYSAFLANLFHKSYQKSLYFIGIWVPKLISK